MNKGSLIAAGRIADLCEQAGCDKDKRKLHYQWYVREGWNPHPPQDFVAWWMPYERDPVSGADKGGHPEARRVWARKDPGRWVHRTYGIGPAIAWNSDNYQKEYLAWLKVGRPQRDYISIAATSERQKQFWHEIKNVVAKIGKPMP